MDTAKKNKTLWQDLHKRSQFRTRYPHERVIQFVFGNFPKAQAKKFKILDHGSGAGRHVIFLAENGYQTYGADISSTGNAYARKIAKSKNFDINLSLINSNILKYNNDFFDGIISFGVLYYLNSDQLDKVIPDLYRILKKGGKMLVILRSKKDYRFKYAKSIGHGDYIIVGDTKTRVNNERGMLMHFFKENEIKKKFNKFRSIAIDRMINTYGNRKMVDYDYVVELVK